MWICHLCIYANDIQMERQHVRGVNPNRPQPPPTHPQVERRRTLGVSPSLVGRRGNRIWSLEALPPPPSVHDDEGQDVPRDAAELKRVIRECHRQRRREARENAQQVRTPHLSEPDAALPAASIWLFLLPPVAYSQPAAARILFCRSSDRACSGLWRTRPRS